MKETMLSKYLKISPIEANKIEMAILFLLNSAFQNKKQIYKMHVFKFLSFLEWKAAKEFSGHFFILNFVALKWGPVPYKISKFINENGTFQFFTYSVLKKEKDNDLNKILFSFKNLSPTYFEDYFNWEYFSENEKKILKEASEWILKFKNTNLLSDNSHRIMKSWEKAWEKAVENSKKAFFFDFSYEIGIPKTDEDYEEILKLYKIECKNNYEL
ncbi:DUF4065 domain-containing protein (plasmid) [Spiroplasma citri]|uniref:type II toxin-antitoxin system antitoxin SocA domain-containing protein n=1 Tax=Spiroplasma citri TaxID=2133 RepID=UPI0013A0AB11|nr:type II toxin-antitoxin system antitoxin SocA domain-containing protein [Spiroplasma citri]QIA74213.1 DUF4065 domain-containing protein [Spiroplasma citri]